jgi:hypothetical protein
VIEKDLDPNQVKYFSSPFRFPIYERQEYLREELKLEVNDDGSTHNIPYLFWYGRETIVK